MADTPAGPCAPWIDESELDGCVEGSTIEQRTEAAQVATELLWALSGRRYGLSCPVTLRPCLRGSCGPEHLWARWTWGHQTHPCDRFGGVLDLGGVGAVDSVTIDGVPFTDWVVDDGRLLRRTDGYAWPLRQDLDLAGTETGTFEVVVRYGETPTYSGLVAARALGCEVLRLTSSAKCKLPRRTSNVSRQGVTLDLSALSEFLVNGATGIDEVDLFLIAVNPNRLASRSTVLSPDRPAPRRR